MSEQQEIFDRVVRHMRRQGVQALNECGMCAYRTPSGLKCAVGSEIADEDYVPAMEGSIRGLVGTFYARPSIAKIKEHYYLFQRLQAAHDTKLCWENPSHMEFHLRSIASLYGLSDAVVNEWFPKESA